MKPRRPLALMACWASVVAALAASGAAAAQASPALGIATPELLGVSALSGKDVWAVGDYRIGRHAHALAEHFNGKTWSITRIREPLGTKTSLNSVAAVSSHDVWAVGSLNKGFPTHGLVLHWDGSGWAPVALPTAPVQSRTVIFTSVSASSADNIWIGGRLIHKGRPRHQTEPVVVHWNGTTWTWTVFRLPHASIDALTTTSPTSAWAVGSVFFNHRPGRVVVEHWNGHVWTTSPAPSPLDDPELLGVSVVAPGNVWAVGDAETLDGESGAVAEHFTAGRWHAVQAPAIAGMESLSAVSGDSATDVWAVGIRIGALPYQAALLHWNGTSWKRYPGPASSGTLLTGVAAVHRGSAWAVGLRQLQPRSRVVCEHWDGHAWARSTCAVR